MDDPTSLANAVKQAGFKVHNNRKAAEHWQQCVHSVINDHSPQTKHLFTSTLHGISEHWKAAYKELVHLAVVRGMFDETLSLASQSVRSMLLRDAPSQRTNSTVDTTESDTTTATDTGSSHTNTD